MEFIGIAQEAGRHEGNQLRHEYYNNKDKEEQEKDQHGNGFGSKIKSRILAFRNHFLGEERDESAGKSSFGKQAAEQVGEFESNKKGIGDSTGAQKTGKQHISDETGYSADQRKTAESGYGFEQ